MDIDTTVEALYCLVVIGAVCLILTKTKQPQKRWWVRPWILKRDERGAFRLVNEEFESAADDESFKNFLRMDKKTFMKLLGLVETDIQKTSTLMRNAISPSNRLIITLRFLATGESYKSLHYYFRIGHSTIGTIIPEVCAAICKNLYHEYIQTPNTTAEWLNIAEEFTSKWQFPHTLGAMDGKHIVFNAPRSAGSAYYNYKQTNSIVLLAIVDTNYKFIYVDCGTNGRVSDGGVFQKSTVAAALGDNSLNLPEWQALPNRIMEVPFVFVADAAFPLQSNIMKPFPFRNMNWFQRIFNYRLSRARRVVENAFGILANRWRVLLSTINLQVEKVQLITETCCVLHNFLLNECPSVDPELDVDEDYRFVYGLAQQAGNRPRIEALNIRNEFMNFVNQEGAVNWQHDAA